MDRLLAFGQVLRLERTRQHLSQGELAAKAGFHRNFISLIERGERSPTLDALFELAQALGVPADALVRETDRLAKASSRQDRPA